MACRGVHFAITRDQADKLLAAAGDEELMEIVEEIEEDWDTENLAESDKAWDAMHRCLTDGDLGYGNGPYPLNHCVLGPRQLHKGDEYIVSLVLPNEVRDVATALQEITEEWFRSRYASLVPKNYAPEYGPDDLDYTWSNFESVKELYDKALADGRAVVFTVDQ
jgi:hypothetical protein